MEQSEAVERIEEVLERVFQEMPQFIWEINPVMYKKEIDYYRVEVMYRFNRRKEPTMNKYELKFIVRDEEIFYEICEDSEENIETYGYIEALILRSILLDSLDKINELTK